MEDLFITRLYSSGVLRYAENNSDIDFYSKYKCTKKGPNSLGNKDPRRIPIRQRSLHPSMLGYLDVADTSSDSPGETTSLSPYCDMSSMYFDDSLYENEMHYKIAKMLEDYPLGDEWEELVIDCDSTEQYNEILDALFRAGDGKIRMFAVSSNPTQLIIQKDPREGYRQFDESQLMDERKE